VAENSPMKRSDSMLTRVEEYLRYRRALGYALRVQGGMLLNFARFADQGGHRGPLTCDLAIRCARLPAKADRPYWARRIEVLIGFARYCKIFDPQTEIPPRHLFGPAYRRKTPFLYSCRQLEALGVNCLMMASYMPSPPYVACWPVRDCASRKHFAYAWMMSI
jgi:hypothetical protein